MKVTPDEKDVLARMGAGALSRDGFLGSDARALDEIISDDRAAVASLGLTQERIAAGMEKVLRAAMAAQGAPAKVGDDLTAVHVEARGRIACPWGGCGLFDKGEVRLTDERSGRTIIFTPLSIHLVARHAFHQGRGARFHVEPAELAKIMGRLNG